MTQLTNSKFETVSVTGIDTAVQFARLSYLSESDTESKDELGIKDYSLALKLSKTGNGHDVFLTGINVQAKVTGNHAFWLQWMRYHFQQIISSTSKMHSITKETIADQCDPLVMDNVVTLVDMLINVYHNFVDGEDELKYDGVNGEVVIKSRKELFEAIVYNTPIGYNLTAGITTNYLQLKNMYKQRKKHRMSYWNKNFVEWIKTLPYSEFITGEFNEED